MTFQLSARLFNTFATKTRPGSLRIQVHKVHPFSQTFRPSATQGYGDGQGDIKGEKPQEQGSTTSAQHKAEHPGPEPPATGNNTDRATKASRLGRKSSSENSARSGGSRSKEGEKTESSSTRGDREDVESKFQPGKNYKPKISDMSTPNADSPERQAEVEQHNKEFEQRHDRAPEAEDDKVDKKF